MWIEVREYHIFSKKEGKKNKNKQNYNEIRHFERKV